MLTPNVAELSVAEWRARYPQYDNLTDEQIEDLLLDATDYLENTPCSIVSNLDKRKRLIYLLTAHLAFLFYPDVNGDGGTGFVGRIGNATEGSVSISSGISGVPFKAEFFMQSKYGYDFWERTKIYRMGLYVPGPRVSRCFIRGRGLYG